MTEKKNNTKKSLFTKFMDVDVSKHTYKKPANRAGTVQLSYLSWSWAYSYMRYFDENAKLEFIQYPEYDFTAHHITGRRVDYMNTGNGCYVTCKITIKGETRMQSLPVMDYKNQSISNPTTVDVNKAKQRCFVKCLALFGLGLKLYGMKNITSYKPKGSKYGSNSSNSTRRGSFNGNRNNNRQPHTASKKQVDDISRMSHYKVADKSMPKDSAALNFIQNNGVQSTITNYANYLHSSQAKAAYKIDQALRKLPNKSKSKKTGKKQPIGSTGKAQQGSLLDKTMGNSNNGNPVNTSNGVN